MYTDTNTPYDHTNNPRQLSKITDCTSQALLIAPLNDDPNKMLISSLVVHAMQCLDPTL